MTEAAEHYDDGASDITLELEERQALRRVGIAHSPLAAPGDGSVDGVRIVTQHDHHIGQTGLGDAVQDMLEDGSPTQRGEERAAP